MWMSAVVQVTTSIKRCCTSRQWHQEVWPGTVTTDAPGVTLAGHSRASEVQAAHAYPPVSARQGASVPVKLLHSSRPSRYMTASTLRCTSSADRTFRRRAFAVAGPTMFNVMPDDLRDPAVSITTFGHSMKTHLFSAYQHVYCIRGVSRNALYKSTILTYLVTYYWSE